MFTFQIIPTDRSFAPMEVAAHDGAGVMGIVSRLACKEADVLRDGEYCFSLQLGDNGVWCVFQRETGPASQSIQVAA